MADFFPSPPGRQDPGGGTRFSDAGSWSYGRPAGANRSDGQTVRASGRSGWRDRASGRRTEGVPAREKTIFLAEPGAASWANRQLPPPSRLRTRRTRPSGTLPGEIATAPAGGIAPAAGVGGRRAIRRFDLSAASPVSPSWGRAPDGRSFGPESGAPPRPAGQHCRPISSPSEKTRIGAPLRQIRFGRSVFTLRL